MLRPAQNAVPERDCIRLRSVGCRQHRLSRRHTQELERAVCVCRDRLKRFNDHQDYDNNQQSCRYLIDNTVEFS